jgi:hypothetical protein
MDLDAYRARAQAFATDLGSAHHRRFAGIDSAWDPGPIHARHAALWDDRAIDALREGGHRRLLRFAVEARLGAQLAGVDAARAAVDAEEGLSALRDALAAEPDASRRAALEERRLNAIGRVTPLAAEAVERVRGEARTLGWPSARAMFAHLHGIDLGALAAEAESLLRGTAPPSLPAWVAARQDLPRLHALDVARTDGEQRLAGVLCTLGLRAGFAMDTEPRPGKSPRAFCAAVRVPQEVHLVAPPGDAVALFHEAGHALHLSYRDAAAPFEDRHLVDRAQAEGVAFLFEQAAGRVDPELDALRTRHLAAALLHDLDLLDDGAHPALAERYARRLAGATGLDWPRAPWLAIADPLLSSADYLRGLGIAHALAGRLGGEGWWARPAAGTELARILVS